MWGAGVESKRGSRNSLSRGRRGHWELSEEDRWTRAQAGGMRLAFGGEVRVECWRIYGMKAPTRITKGGSMDGNEV